MNKREVMGFMQAAPLKTEAKPARPAQNKRRSQTAKEDTALPALDYSGPALKVSTAAKLRKLHAPKDNSKTVWF